jgi:HD-GYP domain-containing protein (c-di-GMP phosphodiesterase class II)
MPQAFPRSLMCVEGAADRFVECQSRRNGDVDGYSSQGANCGNGARARAQMKLPLTAEAAWVLKSLPDSLQIKILQERLEAARSAIIFGLNQLLDLKDLNTGVHSTRLAEWGVRVADNLGVDESHRRDVEAAALLHDIGKIGIPDAILQKPGRLTPPEMELMQKHSEYGWTVLRLLPGFERVSLLVLHHHERVDGKGYPTGLKGDEIPLGSRIVCVLDAFDAMISSRCYRAGLSLEEAVRRLEAGSGTQFDPDIVRLFLPLALAELPQVSQIAEPVSPMVPALCAV